MYVKPDVPVQKKTAELDSRDDSARRRAYLMARNVTYWVTTILLAALSVLAAIGYLSGSPQSVEGFAHVGYPQQLRIILGIAKPFGAITLIVPGMIKLKEWAYAGFTFAWILAFIAHYLAKDGARAFAALVFLLILAISYVTRPLSRQCQAIRSV
jgi:hypothetical protein